MTPDLIVILLLLPLVGLAGYFIGAARARQHARRHLFWVDPLFKAFFTNLLKTELTGERLAEDREGKVRHHVAFRTARHILETLQPGGFAELSSEDEELNRLFAEKQTAQ